MTQNEPINQYEKLSYDQIPPALQKLMQDLVDRVREKIQDDESDQLCWQLEAFIAGKQKASQVDLVQQMAALLRALI